MNSLFGALLLGAAAVPLLRIRQADEVDRFLLTLFWGILGFFSAIRPGHPTAQLDPEAWFWVDPVLFPGILLAAFLVHRTRGAIRTAAVALAGGGVGCAAAAAVLRSLR